MRAVQIYRNFEIGKLIKLIMLDTRIIGRSPQNASLAAVNVRAPRIASHCADSSVRSLAVHAHLEAVGLTSLHAAAITAAANTGMHV